MGGAGGSGSLPAGPSLSTSAQQRDRLLEGNSRVASSNDKLVASQQTLLQAEETGASILSALASQRQTLTRTRQTLDQASADVKDSDTIVTRMGRWWRLGL